jgi:SAM-dependent methyltransferase
MRRPAFGLRRRTRPVSPYWGFDRGTPIDRHFIERYLTANADAIRGRVLEVQDDLYASRLGQPERVDVLDVDPANAHATLVADLGVPGSLPAETYDCALVTQVLQFVGPLAEAIANLQATLRPGGTLLATVPTVSRVSASVTVDGDFWRLTEASARLLFGAAFGAEYVEVMAYGNVLASVGFLHGLVVEELPARRLDDADPYFPTLVAIRATKAAT